MRRKDRKLECTLSPLSTQLNAFPMCLLSSIQLQDLELVPDALSHAFGGPIELKWGRIGRLDLWVPWSSLGTKPIEVRLWQQI